MAIDQRVAALIGDFKRSTRLDGGDIAETFMLEAPHGRFVLKQGNSLPQGIFASEAYCLSLIAAAGVPVPRVVKAADDFLLMEYLEPGARDDAAAGRALARLHAQSGPGYGLDRDTYLATVLQNNTFADSWADFYWRQRLEPVLQLLPVYNATEASRWQEFSVKIEALLTPKKPALLHGDLWAGNLYDAASGPVFIDPACYYGDPLVDIAMTRLFGGFGPEFYRAYADLAGRREAERECVHIYQIYPLLVHSHLFDRGRPATAGYYASAVRLRDAFLR